MSSPGLLPAASVPPDATVNALTDPEPPRVAPLCTVTALWERVPSTTSRPPATEVEPLREFVPVRVKEPAPSFVKVPDPLIDPLTVRASTATSIFPPPEFTKKLRSVVTAPSLLVKRKVPVVAAPPSSVVAERFPVGFQVSRIPSATLRVVPLRS